MGDWSTIESDPGLFTQLTEEFGVKNVEFTELFSLDDEFIHPINTVYGLVFLLK